MAGERDLRAARRYATALFATAEKQNKLDAVTTDLHTIVDFMDQTPALEQMWTSKVVPTGKKRELMSTLQLYLYWKRGVELRPIANPESKYFSVDPVIPYAAARAHDLPERFQWSYEYAIPSAGVPLTDSLVLVLRTPEGHMVARVAARL